MKLLKLKLSTVVLLTLTVLTACKKGENDPFLSLRSRNARITGEWKLTSQESSETNVSTTNGNSITDVSSSYFDGATMNETNGGTTDSRSYAQTIEIRKDGTYLVTIIDDGTTYQNEGNWWWLDSKEKKVRIAFDDDWGSYYIDRLKNKEMVLKIDESSSTSESGFSSSTTSTGTWKFEKQ